MAHQAGAYPGFHSMKRLGVFYSPLDGMLVHRRVTPSIKFAGTHLYTWLERGTVRVKCLAYEHNAMSPVRARTGTARFGVKRTNHEATAPLKRTNANGDELNLNPPLFCHQAFWHFHKRIEIKENKRKR